MNRFYLLISVTIPWIIQCQIVVTADPFNLLSFEQGQFRSQSVIQPTLIRPFFPSDIVSNKNWDLSWRSDYFGNNGAPNLENTSNLWIGRGSSVFSSVNFSYRNQFLALTIEPYFFYNQNKDYNEPNRFKKEELKNKRPQTALTDSSVWKFSRLNDMRAHSEQPYSSAGFREVQLYMHYKYIGAGISNANMWWGPGFHSSLNMTNNTTGFPHLMIGTLRDKFYKNFSVNARYFFAKLDKNTGEPYFTALTLTGTYHSEPIITLGFSRMFLSGGKLTEEKITWQDAAKLPFQAFVNEELVKDPNDPTSSLDEWDQTLAGYVSMDFPRSGLKLYIEYGQNDARWDWYSFRGNPDHSSASVIGFRKYGVFGKDDMVMGFEYTSLVKSKFWYARKTALWYGREQFDFSSYDGRHFAAHSGPDSDDFSFYVGYLGKKYAVIPMFNYERHGVIAHPLWPETKFEYRLDLRYEYKGYQLSLYFEREFVENFEFKNHQTKWSSVIWLKMERNLTGLEIPWLSK